MRPLVLTFALLLVAGCGGGDSNPKTGSVDGRPAPVGKLPSDVATGEDAVWVAARGSDAVFKVDPESGRPVDAPIKVDPQPDAIAVGAGAVWVTSSKRGTVTRIEPRTGVAGRPQKVGRDPSALVVARGTVAVLCTLDDTVVLLDSKTGRRKGRPIRLDTPQVGPDPGRGAVDITVRGRDGWVVDNVVGEVRRVRLPGGESPESPYGVGNEPEGVASGFDALWTADQGSDTVTRVVPGERESERVDVTEDPPANGGPVDVATGEGGIWVADDGGRLLRVDPKERVLSDDSILISGAPSAVAVGFGRVWVTSRQSGLLTRVKPG